MSSVIYLLDNAPFKNHNIFVSNSYNLFDKSNFKESISHNWADEHGYDIDLNNRFKESKQITLECFIPACSLLECIAQYNNFLNELDKKGSRRLSVIIENLRMEYQVFRSDLTEMKLMFDDVNKVGLFTLKLIENMPIKRVLKTKKPTTIIELNSPKILVINWGDGTEQYTSPGFKIYSKTYADNKTYYPIILGDIDSIAVFNSNTEILWNKF